MFMLKELIVIINSSLMCAQILQHTWEQRPASVGSHEGYRAGGSVRRVCVCGFICADVHTHRRRVNLLPPFPPSVLRNTLSLLKAFQWEKHCELDTWATLTDSDSSWSEHDTKHETNDEYEFDHVQNQGKRLDWTSLNINRRDISAQNLKKKKKIIFCINFSYF